MGSSQNAQKVLEDFDFGKTILKLARVLSTTRVYLLASEEPASAQWAMGENWPTLGGTRLT